MDMNINANSNHTSRTKQSLGINIGTSSILVIFVTLCLVCFATLSISSAYADYTLSKKVAGRTSDYYNACNEAYETLAEINENLKTSYLYAASDQEYFDFNGHSTTYSVPISEIQELQVTLEFLYPKNIRDGLYKIESWKVVSTGTLEYDDTLTMP